MVEVVKEMDEQIDELQKDIVRLKEDQDNINKLIHILKNTIGV